jgi:hypothetical protein
LLTAIFSKIFLENITLRRCQIIEVRRARINCELVQSP